MTQCRVTPPLNIECAENNTVDVSGEECCKMLALSAIIYKKNI